MKNSLNLFDVWEQFWGTNWKEMYFWNNVWCIKNRTNHSSKTLMSLVRFLLHQTLFGIIFFFSTFGLVSIIYLFFVWLFVFTNFRCFVFQTFVLIFVTIFTPVQKNLPALTWKSTKVWVHMVRQLYKVTY